MSDVPAQRAPTTAVSRSLPPGALRELLNATSTVVAVKDLDGHYLYINQAFLDLMGGTSADYLGHTDVEIFDVLMAVQLRANDRKVLEHGGELEFEEHLTLNGERRIYRTRKYPLLDADGKPWGVCLNAEEVTRPKRTEDALRSIALGISAATGPAVFELTAINAASALGVEFAFVAALETDGSMLQTLAVARLGQVGGSMHYAVPGTPSARVLECGFIYHSGTVLDEFPNDEILARDNLVSYAGHRLTDSRGRPTGVLAICHTGPLPERSFVETILGIFSVRAGAELERMRMDGALLVSEQSYRTMFEASEDCIFIHDMDTGAILDVNPRTCEVYGYDYPTMLSLRPGELSTGEPPYTEADAGYWIGRARAGEVVRFEWHRRNSDGSAHWDEVCLKRVKLAGVDRILAVTRDMTERKAREEAIARSEDRLRATIEAALDCIVTMDSSGRILDFNPAAEACFGYTREDAIGHSLADLIIPERYRRAHREGVERYLRTGYAPLLGKRSVLNALRADGSEFPIELAIGVATGADGEVFIGYMRDITARREAERAREALEAQLRQAQKMEAIGHLTGGIAHDFNNILTGIMGYIVMASEAARSTGDARLQQYLQRAHHASARATELIQQMLTFSRGQRGMLRPVPIVSVVRDALQLAQASLPASVQMHTELDATTTTVLADAVQLEQVLMNLCINARDAMNGQGRLHITACVAQVEHAVCSSCQEPVHGRFVELTASDDGPGIPPAVMERMFEPFFSTKQPGQGSGMGLATVHGIVHEHKGHILVRNLPGRGACFRILLPPLDRTHQAAQIAPEAESVEPAAAQERLPPRSVLLVDDDESARDFMYDLLTSWGLHVHAFTAPLGALAAAAGGSRWELAVLDYTMPEMTGLALTAALREHQPDLHVLLYSGYAEGLTPEAVAAAGIAAVLRKPIDTNALLAQLQAALS
jgi:PAS domain S-box-containing protein